MKLRMTAIKALAIAMTALFLGAGVAEAGERNYNDFKKTKRWKNKEPKKPFKRPFKRPKSRPVAGVPEPTGAAVFGLGAALMVGASRLRRRRQG